MSRNRKKKAQKRARKVLPAILESQGRLCHWCRRPLVLVCEVRRIDPGLVRRADHVLWVEGGGQRMGPYATADHVVPLREGGSGEAANVVAACPPCNRTRTRQKTGGGSNERWHCARCGLRRDGGGPHCRSCRAAALAGVIVSLGWAPEPDGRYRHPVRGTPHDLRFAVKIQRKHLGGGV